MKIQTIHNDTLILDILPELGASVLNLRADHVQALAMPTRSSSRDFR